MVEPIETVVVPPGRTRKYHTIQSTSTSGSPSIRGRRRTPFVSPTAVGSVPDSWRACTTDSPLLSNRGPDGGLCKRCSARRGVES